MGLPLFLRLRAWLVPCGMPASSNGYSDRQTAAEAAAPASGQEISVCRHLLFTCPEEARGIRHRPGRRGVHRGRSAGIRRELPALTPGPLVIPHPALSGKFSSALRDCLSDSPVVFYYNSDLFCGNIREFIQNQRSVEFSCCALFIRQV